MILSNKKVNGAMNAPQCEFIAQQMLICASMARDISVISRVAQTESLNQVAKTLELLGAKLVFGDGIVSVNGMSFFDVQDEVRVKLNNLKLIAMLMPMSLHCRKSVEFVSTEDITWHIAGMYEDFLIANQIKHSISQQTAAITMHSGVFAEKLELDGNIDSSVICGLLLSLPLYNHDSVIKLTSPPHSTAEIDITLDIMNKFGVYVQNNKYKTFKITGRQRYKSADFMVEGDFKYGALAFLAGTYGSFVTCKGLNVSSLQSERNILNIIKRMGGSIIEEGGSVISLPLKLSGKFMDISAFPELLPVVAAMAVFADGDSMITMDRFVRQRCRTLLAAVTRQFARIGANVILRGDGLHIHGAKAIRGGNAEYTDFDMLNKTLLVMSTRTVDPITLENTRQEFFTDKFYLDWTALQQKEGDTNG